MMPILPPRHARAYELYMLLREVERATALATSPQCSIPAQNADAADYAAHVMHEHRRPMPLDAGLTPRYLALISSMVRFSVAQHDMRDMKAAEQQQYIDMTCSRSPPMMAILPRAQKTTDLSPNTTFTEAMSARAPLSHASLSRSF